MDEGIYIMILINVVVIIFLGNKVICNDNRCKDKLIVRLREIVLKLGKIQKHRS